MTLTIELIPASAWGNNIRTYVTQKEWDRIRREAYKKANWTCEICGQSDCRMECHEVWEYDEQNNVQKLIRLICLCSTCHLCKHYGLAQIKKQGHMCREHIKKINRWTEKEVRDHIDKVFRIWNRRSKKEWILDLSLLSSNIKKEKE